jgi:hypothetical protein
MIPFARYRRIFVPAILVALQNRRRKIAAWYYSLQDLQAIEAEKVFVTLNWPPARIGMLIED